jgi:hypothetical protein
VESRGNHGANTLTIIGPIVRVRRSNTGIKGKRLAAPYAASTVTLLPCL